jgi:hypothetical protein
MSPDQAGSTPVQWELEFDRQSTEELRPQALVSLPSRFPLSDKVTN